MQEIQEVVDHRNYQPAILWLSESLNQLTRKTETQIYVAKKLRKDYSFTLGKDVMYYDRPGQRESEILDFPVDVQLQLLTEGIDSGKYGWGRLIYGNSYSDFIQAIKELENDCRPKLPRYKFKSKEFADFVKNRARFFFEM
ncbi:MAG TPA: hypothetical protein VJJ76_01695 [archaeon]|nr:hypothetical protein [archaeon]